MVYRFDLSLFFGSPTYLTIGDPQVRTLKSLLRSSRDRRSIEQLLRDLHEGRVALLLGAGVDLAMSNSLSWNALVGHFFPAGAAPKRDLLSSWPIELATAARYLLGSEEYYSAVQRGMGSKRKASPYWDALEKLSGHVPLIVTTNYSRWIFEALSAGSSPTVVDRTTLRSARLPEPGAAFTRATLVHLHGRGNEIVLDRSGYDHAQYQDLLYQDFLVQLFERWTVLAIGLSFADPPLRYAASLARTRRPELSRSHIWLDRGSRDKAFRWHSRAAFLSYSIRRVECESHEEIGELTRTISHIAPSDPADAISHITRRDFHALADSLDAAGDYESSFQRQVFHDVARTRNLCIELQRECKSGILLARLERHLRHHAHLIQPKADAVTIRRSLWEKTIEVLAEDKSAAKAITDQPQVHLDLLLGAIEVGDKSKLKTLLRKYGRPSKRLLAARLERAEYIWPSSSSHDRRQLAELRRWAAGVGWESIEAKIALDEARFVSFQTLQDQTRRLKPKEVEAVLLASDASLRAAQYAGTLRRAIGSLILQSLWTLSEPEAKAVLRSAVALVHEEVGLETTLLNAVAWAWQRLFDNRKEAFQDVAWVSPPSDQSLLDQGRYWKDFTPFERR